MKLEYILCPEEGSTTPEVSAAHKAFESRAKRHQLEDSPQHPPQTLQEWIAPADIVASPGSHRILPTSQRKSSPASEVKLPSLEPTETTARLIYGKGLATTHNDSAALRSDRSLKKRRYSLVEEASSRDAPSRRRQCKVVTHNEDMQHGCVDWQSNNENNQQMDESEECEVVEDRQGNTTVSGPRPKWTKDENRTIVLHRGEGRSWDYVASKLPGRTAIACRLHYQNVLERRPKWGFEQVRRFACLYERYKKSMWSQIALEMEMPGRAVESKHWELGSQGIARLTGVREFSTNATVARSSGEPAPSFVIQPQATYAWYPPSATQPRTASACYPP